MECYEKSKNQNLQIITHGGLGRCGMMRGCQTWFQNLNRITFDPLFGKKKRLKTGNIPYFASFPKLFSAKRRIKCYPI